MFENKTEAEARKEILDLVAEYADKFHNQKKEFHEGDRIPYASRVYDSKEMVNLVDSSWSSGSHPDATRMSSRRSLRSTSMCATVLL